MIPEVGVSPPLTPRPPRRLLERSFIALCWGAALLPLGLLLYLVGDVVVDATGRLGWDFLTSYPSRRAERAGILPALVGSAWLMGLTALIALPVGVGSAIYLEEYGGRGRLARLVELNISNLAGVPSILYGLLGLEVFVRVIGLGQSVLAGALTLSLLVFPIVVMSSREAMRAVPHALREASLALGATRWQTVRRVVLPSALPGVLTGAILALSRAVGETAPLVVVGALTYVTFLPEGPGDAFTALPIQIFNWVSRPQQGFVTDAAAGIVVLLGLLVVMNSFAAVLRRRAEKRRASW
jgi:phosphate transport system permease protein